MPVGEVAVSVGGLGRGLVVAHVAEVEAGAIAREVDGTEEARAVVVSGRRKGTVA